MDEGGDRGGGDVCEEGEVAPGAVFGVGEGVERVIVGRVGDFIFGEIGMVEGGGEGEVFGEEEAVFAGDAVFHLHEGSFRDVVVVEPFHVAFGVGCVEEDAGFGVNADAVFVAGSGLEVWDCGTGDVGGV